MANTARTNEIDEVMSSVRRLVSKVDLSMHNMPSVHIAAPTKPEEPQQPARFVLTPSLRVDDDSSVDTHVLPVPMAEPESIVQQQSNGCNSAKPAQVCRDARIEKRGAARAGNFDMEHDNFVEMPIYDNRILGRKPQRQSETAPVGDPPAQTRAATHAPEVASNVAVAPTTAQMQTAPAAAAPMAAANASPRARGVVGFDELDDVPEGIGWEGREIDSLVAAALASVASQAAAFSNAKADDLIAAAKPSAIEPAPVQADIPPAAPARQERHVNDAEVFEDSMKIHESVLREMVVDIIREELAGVLGERITRNVRKLVRREINRVLISHGIE